MLYRGDRLYGVKLPLVQLVLGASTVKDILVTCGLRTIEEQRALVQRGASQTMKSYHLTGDAVDLACTVKGVAVWDWHLYAELAVVMKDFAKKHGVRITWGGDWKTLKDGPHFQIETDPTVAV